MSSRRVHNEIRLYLTRPRPELAVKLKMRQMSLCNSGQSGCTAAPRCLSQVSLNTATVVTVGVGDFAIIYRDVFARCVGHLKYATNISNNVKSLKKIIKSALQHFWMSLHRDIARYRSYCHPHKLLAITLECR